MINIIELFFSEKLILFMNLKYIIDMVLIIVNFIFGRIWNVYLFFVLM